ncbi:Lethal(2) giant larvae protein 1 [Saguinus oedipus]|uniref:Lethal(2) giant larvae protein 1 n=1 Tax=Saguinus oedipus TaxID=9490 RepID=A0ABQ9VNT1_SAGOE|nr:Lethal(2) giant larvae protein 1 [Saguinus oedipus]
MPCCLPAAPTPAGAALQPSEVPPVLGSPVHLLVPQAHKDEETEPQKGGWSPGYGAPGVEFTGLHRDAATVTQMHFLPGQGRLLTLLDDSSLHLWEIVHHNGCAHLEEALSFQLPSRPGFDGASVPPSLTRVTVVLLVAASDIAALGTEGSSVFFLDVTTLTLLEGQTLAPGEVLRSVPDDYRCGKALGPVESLQGHLRHPTKILIGYSRGLLVIWNQASQCADHVFLGNQVGG